MDTKRPCSTAKTTSSSSARGTCVRNTSSSSSARSWSRSKVINAPEAKLLCRGPCVWGIQPGSILSHLKYTFWWLCIKTIFTTSLIRTRFQLILSCGSQCYEKSDRAQDARRGSPDIPNYFFQVFNARARVGGARFPSIKENVVFTYISKENRI